QPLPYPMPVGEFAATPARFASKEIDLLIAMDMRLRPWSLDVIGNYAQEHQVPRTLPAALYESLIGNRVDYPYRVFERVVLDQTGARPADNDRERFRVLVQILHLVDMRVRRGRRINLLRSLRSEACGGRVVYLSPPTPMLPHSPNAPFLGHVPPSQYLELLASSRMTVFANPTYPRAVNERVPAALM